MTNSFKPKAILLDRDGVINEEPGPILKTSQFKLIKKSADAISKLNKRGIYCIVITNQSSIAKRQIEFREFVKITYTMNNYLLRSNAKIDAQFVCPHHPFWINGKKLEEPIFCNCRKPEVGLFFKSCNSFGILPNEIIMIGDSTRDFEASKRFGCKSFGVKTGHAGTDKIYNTEPDYWFPDLWSAILSLEKKDIL